MAVFFKNDCSYNGCGKSFSTLSSLIEHIEGTHLDFDPKVSAGFELQKPSALPLSYILKFSHCRLHKTTNIDVRMRLLQHANKALDRLNNECTPVSSVDAPEIVTESESSNDSWTPTRGISFKKNPKLLPYKEKPYGCVVPGCKKRYKNINGFRYHCKNGHNYFGTTKRNYKKSKIDNKRTIFLKRHPSVSSGSSSNSNSSVSLPNSSSIIVRQEPVDNTRKVLVENVKVEDQHFFDNNICYSGDFKLSCHSDLNNWHNGFLSNHQI